MSEAEDTVPKRKRPSSSEDEDEPENKKKPGVSSSDAITWDVNECRGDHESQEHWGLRKHFLEENMGRFTKARLICLSQVFANMEFLGCRYPEETMELVQELSMGIVEGYREKQKTRLQRTFVKASDAAERKTKGLSTNRVAVSAVDSVDSKSPASAITHKSASSNNSKPKPPGKLEDIILMIYLYNNGENAAQIVNRSCQSANVPLTYDYTHDKTGFACTCHIGNSLSVNSDGGHFSKEYAKGEAIKRAFYELQKVCYVFVTKLKILPETGDGKEVLKDDILSAPTDASPAISENNIGNKLLKLMGWSGGGLGKDEQGIHQAISADGVVGRSRLGLGSSAGASFQQKIQNLLKQQKEVGFTYDLKFSSDFSKDERKEIHLIAQRLGLKSKSYGKEEDRFIVISEKTSRRNLITNTIQEGGETDKYRVIPPGGSIHGIEDFI